MRPVRLITLAAVFVIVSAVFSYVSRNQPGNSGSPSHNISQDVPNIVYQPQTDEQGEVVVEVVPLKLSKDAQVWKFKVVLNTHSVELDADMAASSVLFDDSGREYSAISWEGTQAGGHHREGTLSFTPVTPMSKSVEIRIKDIGGVASRSFKWQLSNGSK